MLSTSAERDQLLTEFGKITLQDRYLLPSESYQDMFARVASAFAEDEAHAQRMYDYISKTWFMPATPSLSNGGTERGLPISCYLNAVQDSMDAIRQKWDENVLLGAGGGGIGTSWAAVRSIGEPVKGRGGSSGVIPFIKVMDSVTLAVSQGSLRRGAGAAYLPISHPEVEEFLEMRKPTGDINRKSLNLHHGLVVPDEFMFAVRDNAPWNLVDPKSGAVKSTLNARDLLSRLLEIRLSTGEPYLIFEGNVRANLPEVYKALGLSVQQSNLCTEILLHTGPDHLGNDRTAVCCLGSVNAEWYDEWKDNPLFIKDCLLFLDNVLQSFIDRTLNQPGFAAARYAAARERAVGLGVMGFHSYLQRNSIPFESALARSFSLRLHKHLRAQADVANYELALLKGPCPDYLDAVELNPELKPVRFSHMLAVAPTASISIIAGGCSPCSEPWFDNNFVQKTLSGSIQVRNKYLARDLKLLNMDTDAIWSSILENEGSVQHLAIPEHLKLVYRTAIEIDQRWIIELAGDRAPYLDQGQSINLFLKADCHKWDLLMLHYLAWQRGVKSLYYLRSMSVIRGAVAGSVAEDNKMEREKVFLQPLTNYEECLSCQ